MEDTLDQRIEAKVKEVLSVSEPHYYGSIISELIALNETSVRIAVALEMIAADAIQAEELRKQLKAQTDALKQSISNQPKGE